MEHSNRSVGILILLLVVGGCSSEGGNDSGASGGGGGGVGGHGTAGEGGSHVGMAGTGGTGGAGGLPGVDGGTAGGPATDAGVVGNCSPPDDIYNPIQSLTLTGCMDPKDPTKPIDRAVPYEVNSPLWSDGADKTRAFVLPLGQKIHVDATTGKWVFPVGSVLIKSFLFDGKLVETRLFMHADADHWAGYAYKWNGQGTAKQTEATLAAAEGADVMFDTGKRTVHWYYPSQQDCLKCHNDVAGNTLGPENAQMYRTLADMKNQLDELQSKGVFDAPVAPPKASDVLVTPYPSQVGSPPATATLEQKARSYLQANCAHCHRPNDGFIMSPFPNFDLRYTTAFKDMKICNAPVAKGMVPGSNSMTILVPGKPMDSIMWLRINAPYTDTGTMVRMPQIASHVVDTEGVKLIGDWITSIQTCP
jgi:uncharacterized repeat protein (TIGR03806 family)